MKKDALLRLADLLERRGPYEGLPSLTDKNFNLSEWFHDYGETRGTVACAVGWAASDPWFNAEGLKLEPYSGMTGNDMKTPTFIDADGWKYRGYSAVNYFFDIEGDTSSWLFSYPAYDPEDVRNPLAVAKRIREFVSNAE